MVVNDSPEAQFAALIRPLVDSEKMEEYRAVAQIRDEPDWPWCAFVLSFATNGGSAHWDNNIKLRKEEFRWDRLVSLSAEERQSVLREIANPRRRTPLAKQLEQVFERFLRAGGPAAIRKEYESFRTGEELIEYLSTFPGIGPKYARNIPMDAQDRRVEEHFALDSRIRGILAAFLGSSAGYPQDEEFLTRVAKVLNMEPWLLDRFLYNNRETVLREIKSARRVAT